MIQTLDLRFSAGRCRVLLGRGALDGLRDVWQPGWTDVALIGDRNVLGLFGERVERQLAGLAGRVVRADFPAGEAHKTRETKAALEDVLLGAGLGRDALVVGLGGGVSLDLAGFVAATYMRGLAWLGLPTSLLAQVDASIGGKTGVDTPQGKNLVGAFHQPAAVLIDPDWPGSLPAVEWPNGLAELVKAAVVADAVLFDRLEREAAGLARPGPLPAELIRRAIEIKAELVQTDEREAGPRAWLNFGHTVGHALERASGYRLPHGLAVACGMLVEARLAVRRCGFEPEALVRLEALWPALGVSLPPLPDFAAVAPHLGLDKKSRRGRLRLALPTGLGRMARDGEAWTVPAEPDELGEVWLG